MRPAAPYGQGNRTGKTSSVRPPAGMPEEAVVRSDAANPPLPMEAMALAYPVLRSRGGKELLMSPRGLRIVVQVSEADRLRYGVFREARFEDAVIDGSQARTIMDILLAMDEALRDAA
jgi:hypothetical protein